MQEIGVWTTATGASEARLELEPDQGGVAVTELPAWASSALQGAVAGATTGAAGGPYGALIGAVTGGALGAASSAAAPAAAPSSPSADGSRTAIIKALQQFASVVPAIVQLLSASKPGKESLIDDAGESRASADGSEWGPESLEGTWTVP